MKEITLLSILLLSINSNIFADDSDGPSNNTITENAKKVAYKELNFITDEKAYYGSSRVSLEEAKDIVNNRLEEINIDTSNEMIACKYKYRKEIERLEKFSSKVKYSIKYKFSGKYPKKVLYYFTSKLQEVYTCNLNVKVLDDDLILTEETTFQNRNGYEYRDVYPCKHYHPKFLELNKGTFFVFTGTSGMNYYDGRSVYTSKGSFKHVQRTCKTRLYRIESL